MIESFCEQLRKTREERNLDIKEIVEKTKLYPSVIDFIESGQWDKIDPAYLKGFLNIYASFLNLEVPGDVYEFIDRRREITAPQPKKKEKPKTKLTIRVTPRLKKLIVTVLVGLAVIAAVSVLINVIKKISKPPDSDQEKVRVAPSSIGGSSSEASSQEVIVSLKAKKNCFIRTVVDGTVVFEGVLHKGISERWQAKKEIEFKISDGASLDIEVNGKLLPPLTKTPKAIKSLKITTRGISVIK